MAESENATATPPTPAPPTPVENLAALAAIAYIGAERVITDGQIILEPAQSSFTLKWGSVVINAIINDEEVDRKSKINIEGININITLNVLRNSDFYVKFKNVMKFSGNSSHLSIFITPQAAVDFPALLVHYTITSSPQRLP